MTDSGDGQVECVDVDRGGRRARRPGPGPVEHCRHRGGGQVPHAVAVLIPREAPTRELERRLRAPRRQRPAEVRVSMRSQPTRRRTRARVRPSRVLGASRTAAGKPPCHPRAPSRQGPRPRWSWTSTDSGSRPSPSPASPFTKLRGAGPH